MHLILKYELNIIIILLKLLKIKEQSQDIVEQVGYYIALNWPRFEPQYLKSPLRPTRNGLWAKYQEKSLSTAAYDKI